MKLLSNFTTTSYLIIFFTVFNKGGFEKGGRGGGGEAKEAGRGDSGSLVVFVVKGLTSALLTKEDVLALNTFFLHELLKITQRQGCTLFCCRRGEFPPAALCPVDRDVPIWS